MGKETKVNESRITNKVGRPHKFNDEEKTTHMRIDVIVPSGKVKYIKLACHKLIKSMLLVLFLTLPSGSMASSYEIVGYSNKGHYERVFGSALINDSCEIYIVVDSETYYVKYMPETHRDRIDGKNESRATCNGKPCFIAINNGTLETIEIIFESETIKFYIK